MYIDSTSHRLSIYPRSEKSIEKHIQILFNELIVQHIQGDKLIRTDEFSKHDKNSNQST